MIKIIRGGDKDHPGLFDWRIPDMDLRGRSRQPLLDACRELKSICGDTGRQIALYREGNSVPDLSCTIAAGAGLTIKEEKGGNGPRIVGYRPFIDHKSQDQD